MSITESANYGYFSKEGIIAEHLKNVISSIPEGTQVYMIGGAARNAIYYEMTGIALPQRDFDLLLVGDLLGFVANVRKHKFVYGKIRRKNDIVLKRKLVQKPQVLKDYIFIDIHRSSELDVLRNLESKAAFTINGFAIPLEKYLSEDFMKYVISVPNAMEDLKDKRLRLNHQGYQQHSGNLFACLRFMSIGFSPPSRNEVELLLKELPNLEKWRFERNVKKVWDYVGGEEKARELVKSLGINQDIFNLGSLRNKNE